jgi:N-acetylglucosaminyl-diphospho-decaprenol L-rhamnosyltransferase
MMDDTDGLEAGAARELAQGAMGSDHQAEDTAVVVVNFGSHELLAANLGPVPWQGLGCRVIVVDNYATQAERKAVTALADGHGWSVIPLPNKGFGAGVNAGFAEGRRLGCELLLTVNPDARISAEVVAQLRAHSLRDRLALITPTVVSSRGDVEFQGSQVSLADGRIRGLRGEELPHTDVVDVAAVQGRLGVGARSWLTGACMIAHRDLWDRLGGFDESYFLYWEDIDLSVRCVEVGGSLVLRRDLVVTHDEGGTQPAGHGRAKSNAYYFYNCRNRLRFAAGQLPRRAILRWMLLTPAVSWEILMRGGRRQLLHSPWPLLATIRGSMAGLGCAVTALVRTRSASAPPASAPLP